jgi:hypothetical protein
MGYTRQERLYIIAKACELNNVTPKNGNKFAGLVRKIVCGKLGCTVDTATEDTKTMSIAYDTDKWKSILAGQDSEPETPMVSTPVVVATEKGEEVKVLYGKPLTATVPSLQKFYEEMKHEPTEEVKRLQHIETRHKDYLTKREIAKLLYTLAWKNTNIDGVGRIILSDARDAADNKHLQPQELLTIWHEAYPLLEIEQRTGNVFLIYWDGKESLKNLRGTRRPMIDQSNVLPADTSDIIPPETFTNPEEIPANKDKLIVAETEDE